MAPRKVDLKDLEKWFSVKDAADDLGKSRQGIRNMLASRDLTGVHTRIGWLIDPDNALYRQAKTDAAIRKAQQVSRQTREVGA